MPEWKRTFCALCYHNCGLEVQTAGHKITKVRPDVHHPRTQGYVCRKGLKIAQYQDHQDRLTHPMRREGNTFTQISWDQAITEIAGKLSEIIKKHGPLALAYMGGGGQGSHMETAFGRRFLGALGSRYHYSPLAQELTGLFWVNGRAFGRQNLHLGPDLDRAENFLAIGWNGYVSNAGVNRARKRLDQFAHDPDKRLIVVDPLTSETAAHANQHLQPRMGTVALLLKSMIAIVIQQGWENKDYIAAHCRGFDQIAPWFKNFDVAAALQVCRLDSSDVVELVRLYATRPTAIRSDLGLLMDRQSTMNSYLEMILMAVCGRIGTPGGNVFYGHVMPMGSHIDERDPKTWRTMATGFPEIMGYFPPNVVPEEILSTQEDRLRAMIVSGSNPLISYADSQSYARALKELELLVTIEISMTETARLSHYVLPAKSAYEKWDATLFSITFPDIYFQLRHPACEPLGEPWEEGRIYTRLAAAMGLLPEIPDSLRQAAEAGRVPFAMELMTVTGRDKRAAAMMPFMAAETLGKSLGSAHLAAVWGIMMMYPQHAGRELTRAGYQVTPLLGEELFQKLLDHPEGILIGRLDPDDNLGELRTPDKKINLYIEELSGWMDEIEPELERAALTDEEFPLVLMAGRHFPHTANSIMRDPAWNGHETVCTMLINHEDAEALGVETGQPVLLTTAAGQVTIPAEISDIPARGVVVIPHGFGMLFNGREHGVNVNTLTSAKHRDRIAATPLHRYVPCRVAGA
ncbi:MAG: molybdopterin-dependent oxidoreductase [Deltaproteobacteria bacterium]|nr:molybdopterin-dependent oxidoreductase [Deltaproteobacteria bacterium]